LIHSPLGIFPDPATLARARFASGQGEGAESRGRGARRDVHRFPEFFRDGKTFVGGEHRSIADIRQEASLEFLKVIHYYLAWAEPNMGAVAKTLAYAEPTRYVEGYIAYVKGRRSRYNFLSSVSAREPTRTPVQILK
jgi:hypothetical protein